MSANTDYILISVVANVFQKNVVHHDVRLNDALQNLLINNVIKSTLSANVDVFIEFPSVPPVLFSRRKSNLSRITKQFYCMELLFY